MPLIEELPITQSHRISHGWAYVPDTGPAPIAAVKPGNRKRNRDGTLAITASATAKQQKAVQARLDSLDKENYKDGVSVPIPSRPGAEKKKDKKMTPNVRRILTYQRAFAHYLADEEANLAAGGGTTTTQQSQTAGGKPDGRRKAIAVETATPSTPPVISAPRRGRPPKKDKNKTREDDKTHTPVQSQGKQEDLDKDTPMIDASPHATSTTHQPQPPTQTTIPPPRPTYDSKLDSNPLLRTLNLPKMPSDRVMAALVAEPPLSYAAARAKQVEDDGSGSDRPEKPVRRFCAVCGYWGKVKCRKCGEWTCGLMECWKGHEGVCVAQGMF